MATLTPGPLTFLPPTPVGEVPLPALRGRRKYTGDYQTRSRLVREAAYANPFTRCRLCLLTLSEAQEKHPEKVVRWDAGHRDHTDPRAPLAAEHAHCNRSEGQAYGVQKRRSSGGTGRV